MARLVYTDASATGLKVRIGALLVADDKEFFCAAMDPGEDVVASWKCSEDSEVVITPAELFAGLVRLQTFEVHLRGRDVLWFVGNLPCRVWAEYVPEPEPRRHGGCRRGSPAPKRELALHIAFHRCYYL